MKKIFCDRCGKEMPKRTIMVKPILEIDRLFVEIETHGNVYNPVAEYRHVDLCDDCLEKIRAFIFPKEKNND